ncbi:MAG: hypothetical protein ABSF53_04800 [Terracidiphilus sp.]
MELWTEYEGKTIDGAFPLKKLLLPEGRSAFFSTLNGNGVPTVIRLIESHFDADEILARWRGVQALGHPNLLKLEQYSQLAMDGTTVIYAVMEPVEANLAEVLSGQRLTVSDTMQLAESLSSALDVLHTHGFVHEHVEPANIFAVGDVVKLRSDCIRESPEGEEGAEAKRRDLHDLAVVLLEALTQKRTLAAAGELPLPSPFDQIVRQSMSGEWSVAEIQTALQTPKRPSAPSSAFVPNPTRSAVDQPAAPSARPISLSGTDAPDSESTASDIAPPGARLHLPAEDGVRRTALGTRSIAAGLVVMLALWLGWHFAHSGLANRNDTRQLNPGSASTTGSIMPDGAPAGATTGAPTAGSNHDPVQHDAVAAIRAQWRVVAYTYNREEQAQKKSATIAQEHPELRPEVFAPSGHAPYLVTVGGVMNRDDAFAFVQKARNSGLPSDTYAQNYNGKAR